MAGMVGEMMDYEEWGGVGGRGMVDYEGGVGV